LARKAFFVDYKWWDNACVKSIWSDLECIKRHNPDAVLGDMHWSAGTAAEMAGLPYISVANAHWTNYFSAPIRALKDHLSTRLLGKRLADRFFPYLRDWVGGYWVLPYRRFHKKHKLSPEKFKNILSLCEGDLTLLADIPEYGPTENTPPNFHYVGPILWEPTMAMPSWYDRLNPDKPVLYFTMGSTGHTRFFNDAIKLFKDTDYQVVMTTGGLFAQLDRFPTNFFIEDFAPGRPIMEKSKVVINHGGNGTVYQALVSGTPIIGIPYHVDQEINLQRVEALGFGRMISEKQCNEQTLLHTVETLVHDPSFAENARKHQPSLDQYPGAVLAARHIHDFLNG